MQRGALNFHIGGKTLPDLWELPISGLLPAVEAIRLPKGDRTAATIHTEIHSRLRFLDRIGLGYLNLDRPTRTLSGGELERVNLTTCLGAALTGTLFVLDEPSIGLHPRDIGRLTEVLAGLRDRGNTLLVVEHEEAVMRAADNLIEVGPGRGDTGGEIVFSGPASKLLKTKNSLTADYLSGRKSIPVPSSRREPDGWVRLIGARAHNLRGTDADFPLGVFTCVTGVSGSGKSTLVHNVLFRNLRHRRGEPCDEAPADLDALEGHEALGEVIMVDQSPLARTPRSTPAVYTKAFDPIRALFAATPDAVAGGLKPGFFSFNSGEGRCGRCWGNGAEKIEMQFLSDVFVPCPECEGRRYGPDVLDIRLEGKSIADVLDMTVAGALEFFGKLEAKSAARVVAALAPLAEVGLGYLTLGQPLNTLSGGESQRLKLVSHLPNPKSKKSARKNPDLLLFDEPTTGLHFDDIAVLLKVFARLVDAGHSVLVIEHNPEVVKCADHVIDLGPEAGTGGGEIVVTGTPEEVARCDRSHTGRALAPVLNPKHRSDRLAESPATPLAISPTNAVEIRGAREHNLKNLDIDIPRDRFVVVTGLSGSGKSTLAFDLVFAEGQRRFLDSMSTYARQFVEQVERPEVDRILGLPPTVAIEQRISRGGGKSTVGTVTEVYHFLRLLWAKVGTQFSPDSGKAAVQQSQTAIARRVREAARRGKIQLLAPLVRGRKGYHTDVARWARRKGYEQLLVDGHIMASEGFERLERFREHHIDAVVAELDKATPPSELRSRIEEALRIGKGTAKILEAGGKIEILSQSLSCPVTGRSFDEPDPRIFSFNSPHGWCPECRGYGKTHRSHRLRRKDFHTMLEAELDEERKLDRAGDGELETCRSCGGARLNEVARHVKVHDRPIYELTGLPVSEARAEVAKFKFTGREATIARDILTEIDQRLRFMESVGLGYLSMDRAATTLSGGEAQRIRLAAQLGSNLRGVLYVLDEPTIGLHPRDNDNLLTTLTALRDAGNSLLVVEHDEETMRAADHVIDLGPGAGQFGGEVVATGSLAQIRRRKNSTTGKCLRDPQPHPSRGARRELPKPKARKGWLKVRGAVANNLKNLDLAIPTGRLTVITGVSGSGKSSFLRGVLLPAAKAEIAKANPRRSGNTRKKKRSGSKPIPAAPTWKSLAGFAQIAAVYEVDQSPIGKTSRSCPATYTKVFDDIRKLFATVPAARMRGFDPGRFSFNTEGGRCETCAGNGRIKHEMTFLPTSWVPCEACGGARYNPATLEVTYDGKTIADVMDMTASEAAGFFSGLAKIHRPLSLLAETGTGYLKLGQPSPTLSGGEAQRIKLVAELSRGIARSENARLRGRAEIGNLYLIEEPTIGLHMADVEKLIDVLHRLVDAGNTVVVIEHNLDLIAEADYLIDIGPEAGAAGGELVAAGTPEEVARSKTSRTAPFLREMLGKRP